MISNALKKYKAHLLDVKLKAATLWKNLRQGGIITSTKHTVSSSLNPSLLNISFVVNSALNVGKNILLNVIPKQPVNDNFYLVKSFLKIFGTH
jgi:hypothetical protein